MTDISDFVQQSHNFIVTLSRGGKAGAKAGPHPALGRRLMTG
jgi:hypothetical protein